MMAAKGAIYPVFELMRDQSETFSPDAYLPAVTGYYSDVAGNMLSFPFNVSTPILYYNKDLFRSAGLDPETAPKTWPEVGAAAKKLRAAGAPCGFTTSWPSWINVENFSAFHNVPLSTSSTGLGGAVRRGAVQKGPGGPPPQPARGRAAKQPPQRGGPGKGARAALPEGR